MYEHLSFRLADDFVAAYESKPTRWGLPMGGGNTLGELTIITKYSRLIEGGQRKETWADICRRCVEGTYSILKNWCLNNNTPWNHAKAARAAEDMFDRMYRWLWTPPGRGMWMMGTEFVMERGSAALQNCAFLTTANLGHKNPTHPFIRLMEMSMLGVGVGFDVAGAGRLDIHKPGTMEKWVVVDDSREGWYDSVDKLLRSYFTPGQPTWRFDLSKLRAAGAPIKGFGGRSSGPIALERLHNFLRWKFDGREGQTLTITDIADIMNGIGKCVIAGSARRSAEIAIGPDDKEFTQLKNWEINPDRMAQETGWGHLSNNSVIAEVGKDYSHLIDDMALGGEPGLYYLDLARSYGRMVDGPQYDATGRPREWRVMGVNPCGEQPLEDNELCTLVDTYPYHHETLHDYTRSLKAAYLYGKTVTLLPTHWPESNEVMQRNRRIGTSMSGVAQFAETYGWAALREWLEGGYQAISARDIQYSEWLGVRDSIKKTTVKPAGTGAHGPGATPGCHYFPMRSGIRRQRFSVADPMVELFAEAGYHVEADVMDPATTVCVEFPIMGPNVRTEREVSVWEKAHLAQLMQRHWSDNNVSCTITFRPEERDQIGPIIRAFDGQLKSVTFLPLGENSGAYAQMPYEELPEEKVAELQSKIKPLNWKAIYEDGAGSEATGEMYCETDRCEIPVR